MTTRRKFFGLMAATPLAAKEASDKVIADLVIRGEEAAPLAPSVGRSIGWRETQAEKEKLIPQALAWIRKNNGQFPEYVERSYREDASYVSALDPDIASKKSWSMNVKINEQRQRNYQRRKEQYLTQDIRNTARQEVERVLGFKWPW